MAISGSRLLNNTRFNKIVRTLAFDLNAQRPLLWLKRTPVVNADDDEIIGRFTGRLFAADIIADDQPALVYEGWQMVTQSHAIPKLKMGMRFSEPMLQKLQRFENGSQIGGENAFRDWQNQIAETLVTGVRMRMNALCCAMRLDLLDYDRLGIKLSGVSWGMPAALKVTPTYPWTDATNATPLTDIQTLANVMQNTYGITVNRVTSSLSAFTYATQTTEWRNRASGVWGGGFALSAGMMNTLSQGQMLNLFQQIQPGWTWEFDDATYDERTAEGKILTKRYLPAPIVELSRREDDGNANMMDFANAVVTESIVADYVDNAPGIGGAQYGPIGYYTCRDDLNPPDLVAWGAGRGFPRKHTPEATGKITVGTFTT